MIGLRYELSIPKYVFSKMYHSVSGNKLPSIFPNLHLRKNIPEPKLNGANWVKLKSLMSGICGSDQNMLRGHESFSMEPYASFPCILGHENVSRIVELGSNVTEFEVGDTVIVNPVMGCRVNERDPACPNCTQGLDALCNHFGDSDKLGPGMTLGYHKTTGGGWSEFYQAHKWQLHKVPEGTPLERAVLADPFTSAMEPIAAYANGKKERQTVLILGAGTIGLLAVAAIRALELPWKVVVGYRYDYQGKMAKDFGADLTIRTGSGFYDEFTHLLGGQIRKVSIGKPVVEGGVDAIFDCVGTPSTLDDSLRLCKTGGTVVMVATATDLKGVDPAPIWFREVKLQGTCMSRSVIDPRDGEKKQVYEIVNDLLKTVELEKLLTHTFPITDFKKALRTSMNKKDGQVVKVAFKFE